MKITISKENYLKAIAEAEADGEPVIAATLSRWLGVSAPAVAMALRRLKRDNCIQVNSSDGRIQLTREGRSIAERLIRRHYLIERMLTEIFGMEWYKVHEEAEQMEHAVSGEFEKLLRTKLGEDASCPHGNRLGLDSPAERRERGWTPLPEVPVAKGVTVMSVYERDPKLLEYLNGLGIKPGAGVEVLARNYDDTMSLRIAGRAVQIGMPAAQRVWAQLS